MKRLAIPALVAAVALAAALRAGESPEGRPEDGAAASPAPAEAAWYAVVVITDHTGASRTEIVGLAKVVPNPPELQPLRAELLRAHEDAARTWREKRDAFTAEPGNQFKRFPDPFPPKPVVRIEGRPCKTRAEAEAVLEKRQAADLARNDPGKASRRKILQGRLLDHFFWGISASTEWMLETREKNGCRWDVRCGYLSGGAGLGEDPWWLKYGAAEGSLRDAKRHGAVVWFTYYLLAASAPAQATPVNMKVPGTMRDYFTLFKRLMLLCAKHLDVPVVVQIEPDEWGHMLLTAGMDPEKVDVKVGSTGMRELEGLPDDLFGYAAAFERLRNTYSPGNVLLACNPSGWDSGGSMSGTRFGQIMKRVCPDYDLAVFETGDRDKGMHGKAPPYGDAVDICGNFTNHVRWIRDFHAVTGLPVVVWQVAMGNTVFAACNNTPGHHCDNLAQTLLEGYPKNPTIANYVRAGCVGWLFQGGQGDSTCAWDGRKDGVTNPDPIPGNAGQKSVYPDDDGGYIRLRVGEYYKNPYPIAGVKKGTP